MKFSMNATTGTWLDKKILKTGDVIKLTTEAKEVPSQQGGTQIVVKCKVKDKPELGETNISINKPSKNALISAYGDDSINWIGKILTVSIEKTLIAGKRGIAMYLIPEGYQIGEDEGGYLVITNPTIPETVIPKTDEIETVEYPEDDIKPEDIPF